ncbi:hypothetical protein [Halorhabdus rudnickae]|uniref:hypothetical protein n=1 Tax=Halorhabdus rudnickae TaxID=1775544 RepID=UPI00108462B3|nr:hypothetical protein [Halorhabdus rudnickae]
MAVSETPTGEESAEDTITATVGHGFDETREVPQEIGEFEVWDCPNNSTVVFKRDYTPTDDMVLPAIREKYAITTKGEGRWDVTKSVETREEGSGHNIRTGEEYGTVVSDLQTHEPVGVDFETFEAALEHLRRLAEAASVTDTPPKEVKATTNPIHKAFNEVRREERE